MKEEDGKGQLFYEFGQQLLTVIEAYFSFKIKQGNALSTLQFC